jgi:hypothetical protein
MPLAVLLLDLLPVLFPVVFLTSRTVPANSECTVNIYYITKKFFYELLHFFFFFSSEIGSHGTICQGWLQTMILLISASWVPRITGVSHQHSANSGISILFPLFPAGNKATGIYHRHVHGNILLNACKQRALMEFKDPISKKPAVQNILSLFSIYITLLCLQSPFQFFN